MWLISSLDGNPMVSDYINFYLFIWNLHKLKQTQITSSPLHFPSAPSSWVWVSPKIRARKYYSLSCEKQEPDCRIFPCCSLEPTGMKGWDYEQSWDLNPGTLMRLPSDSETATTDTLILYISLFILHDACCLICIYLLMASCRIFKNYQVFFKKDLFIYF